MRIGEEEEAREYLMDQTIGVPKDDTHLGKKPRKIRRR